MEFTVTWKEIKQQSTTTEPNKFELLVEATGSKEEIEEYAYHCGDWPPNSKLKIDACKRNPKKCGYFDKHPCHYHGGVCPNRTT